MTDKKTDEKKKSAEKEKLDLLKILAFVGLGVLLIAFFVDFVATLLAVLGATVVAIALKLRKNAK